MKEQKQISISPRIFGNTNKALMEFFILGKQGYSVIYATPEGNFLSPKAMENERKQACQDMIKYMEEKKFTPEQNNELVKSGANPSIIAAKEYLKTL